MRQISILGVVVGGVFDIVISSIGGAIVIAIAIGAGLFSGGTSPDAQHLAEAVTNSTSLTTGLAIYGSLISVAAGYLAARIANRAELLNGTLSSLLCVIQGVLTLSHTRHSITYVAFELIGPPLCGLAGGYLRALRKQAASPNLAT